MSDSPAEGIRDLGEGVKAEFLSRLRSPLVGAFVISWLLWNHRVLFVLFSDMKVGKKFAFIDMDLFSSAADFWLSNTLWPLLSAGAYIFVVPWATRGVHRWNLWHQRLLHEDDLRSEGLKVLPVGEATKLRALASERRTQVEKLKDEVEELGARMTQLAAMHACAQSRDPGQAYPELADYVNSRPFVMWGDVSHKPLSRHEFSADGGLISYAVNRGAASDADGWELDGASLRLLQKNELQCELLFDSSDGVFRGQYGGINVRLSPAG